MQSVSAQLLVRVEARAPLNGQSAPDHWEETYYVTLGLSNCLAFRDWLDRALPLSWRTTE